jgi:nucleotide-binding universal stress UspA family protein
VVSDPVDGPRLGRLVDGERGVAVLVVAPALHRTWLRYWLSDSDEAIEHARFVEQQTVHALRREDVASSGHVGSPDPIAAIEDALRFFDADRIAIAMHTDGKRRYRERDLRAEVERRFGRPVIAVDPARA